MIFRIDEHRQQVSYTRFELVCREIWSFAQPVFRWSPRAFNDYRNFLLRCFGAKIGRGVRIDPTTRIFAPWELTIEDDVTIERDVNVDNIGPITIGSNSIISRNTQLCAASHDFHQHSMPLVRCPIQVGSNVWIGSDAFVGPGVAVGESAVVGPRASVFSDVESGTVVVGNPATVISVREPAVASETKAAA